MCQDLAPEPEFVNGFNAVTRYITHVNGYCGKLLLREAFGVEF